MEKDEDKDTNKQLTLMHQIERGFELKCSQAWLHSRKPCTLKRWRHESRPWQVLAFLKVINVITVCQRCNTDQSQHFYGLADRIRQSCWPASETKRRRRMSLRTGDKIILAQFRKRIKIMSLTEGQFSTRGRCLKCLTRITWISSVSAGSE